MPQLYFSITKMNNIRFTYLIKYLFIGITASGAWITAMAPLVPVPLPCLILDAVASGVLLTALSFLLEDIIRYGKYHSLPFMQQIINYGGLAVLSALFLIGIDIALLYIVLATDTVALFLPTIPVRIIIALLTYGFIVAGYEYRFKQNEYNDKDIKPDNELAFLPLEAEKQVTVEEQTDELQILEHIAVKNGSKIDIIFIPEIIFIQAEGDYVMIHTTKGKFLKEQTMKYFNDHLPENKFVRVHRSSIINIDFIERIELYEKQNQIVKLQGNHPVKISLAGYKELKKALNL